jgi:choline transport protein
MSEEIINASVVVPRTMILAVLLNGVLGFAMLIAVLFCAGDLTAAIANPTGYPYIEILRQGTGLAGANGLGTIILLIIGTSSFAFLTTASRLV